MSTWLGLLPLELEDVKEVVEPPQEVKDGETLAGEVSDYLRKLYTLSRAMKKQADLLQIEAKYTNPTPEERGKIIELMTKASVLDSIFLIGIHDELGIWGHEGQCAVRSGWQVVFTKAPEFPFPFNMFHRDQE